MGGILYTVTKQDLHEFFGAVGTVVRSYLPIDRERGDGELNRGFAFIEMATPLEAEAVLRSFDGEAGPGGRPIGIKYATDQENRQ